MKRINITIRFTNIRAVQRKVKDVCIKNLKDAVMLIRDNPELLEEARRDFLELGWLAGSLLTREYE